MRHHVLRPLGGVPERCERGLGGLAVALLAEPLDALAALRDAAEGSENVMPYIVDAVKAYATTGEICDAMRDAFGEHRGGI